MNETEVSPAVVPLDWLVQVSPITRSEDGPRVAHRNPIVGILEGNSEKPIARATGLPYPILATVDGANDERFPARAQEDPSHRGRDEGVCVRDPVQVNWIQRPKKKCLMRPNSTPVDSLKNGRPEP